MQSIPKRISDRFDIVRGKRSKRWPRVRKEFVLAHPECAVCGKQKKLQVHHIADFSTTPELELDSGNLITLCMGTYKCHLLFGHLCSFRSINPEVEGMAANMMSRIERRR